jgi:putative endonuclease
MSEILSLSKNTRRFGEIGEEIAARYLAKKGYRLVMANFTVQVGRNRRGAAVSGEIDLIALDGKVLCFVEVKTRRSDDFAAPAAAVDLRKQRQIIRAARGFRRTFYIGKIDFRYDVVSIVQRPREKPEVELFKNFWTEEKFRKKSWSGKF